MKNINQKEMKRENKKEAERKKETSRSKGTRLGVKDIQKEEQGISILYYFHIVKFQ